MSENINLCDICLREYSNCMNEHENMPEIEYGGESNDAVLECSWFMGEEKQAERSAKGV